MASDRPDADLMRFATDSTWNRTGDAGQLVLAGSPLRVFRLSHAGADVCAAIETGDDVAPSSLVERLLDAGAIHPLPPQAPTSFRRGDVTVVTPQLGGSVRPDRDVTVDDGSEPPLDGASTLLSTNRGPAAARNVGRGLVSSDLIAFVDADVVLPDEDWLERLLPHFDDERVGLVAPRVVGDPTASLDLGDEPARIRAGSRVSYVPAAAIVVRATAFDDVGGFDERLRFGEDVDFVWRLDQAGWQCRYVPHIIVHHTPRGTWRARLRQQVGYGSSAAPLALRHPRLLAPIRMNRWMAGGWAAIGLGHPVAGIACLVGNGIDVTRLLPDVPRREVAHLTAASHLAIARQLAATIRRVWWPLAVLGCLVSKRVRLITLASILADPRSLPTDMAYGWGVWRGVVAQRVLTPILPTLTAWPPGR